MRILAVSPYYEPEGGGLERYAHAMNARLAARGHEVRALAFSMQGGSLAMQDGVAVERVAPLLRVGNAAIHPGFQDRVARCIREGRPDVVLAHTPVPFAAEMAFRAAHKEGVPFVTTYHGGSLRGSSPVLHGLAQLDRFTFERRMLAGSARLVAVSPYVRSHALARARGRVTVIPPGVDTERFSPSPALPSSDVLFVAPLDRRYRWKGVDVLWQAFRQVKAAVPDARLVLVGAGDRLEEFRSREHASGGALHLAGHLSLEALVEAYRNSALLVLPSTTDAESFGMVLAEANACGKPVVASAVGGIPDFVRDGDNGLLTPPGDPEALADRIITLLEDPDGAVAMGRRGRERVLQEHDWGRLAGRMEKVLAAAAESREPRGARPVQQGKAKVPLPVGE